MLVFRKKVPKKKTELVLQDQKETIEGTVGMLDGNIRVMVHDFFTPQPIVGNHHPYLRPFGKRVFTIHRSTRMLPALSPSRLGGRQRSRNLPESQSSNENRV